MPLTDPTGTPAANSPASPFLPPANARADQYEAALGQEQGYFQDLPSYSTGNWGNQRLGAGPIDISAPEDPPYDPSGDPQRMPSPAPASGPVAFNSEGYMNALGNQDLINYQAENEGFNPYEHYSTFGQAEDRNYGQDANYDSAGGEFGLGVNIGTGNSFTEQELGRYNAQNPDWDTDGNFMIGADEWGAHQVGRADPREELASLSYDQGTRDIMENAIIQGRDSGSLGADMQGQINALYDDIWGTPEASVPPPQTGQPTNNGLPPGYRDWFDFWDNASQGEKDLLR